jgi:hypothetical protein
MLLLDSYASTAWMMSPKERGARGVYAEWGAVGKSAGRSEGIVGRAARGTVVDGGDAAAAVQGLMGATELVGAAQVWEVAEFFISEGVAAGMEGLSTRDFARKTAAGLRSTLSWDHVVQGFGSESGSGLGWTSRSGVGTSNRGGEGLLVGAWNLRRAAGD